MSLAEQLVNSETIKLVDDVYEFIKFRYLQTDPDEIKRLIWTHYVYGTLDVVYKNEKIISAIRWNMSESGIVIDVLDLFIASGENGTRIMKHLIARNWKRFPAAKYIRFSRGIKYPTRDQRVYPIKRILKLKGE